MDYQEVVHVFIQRSDSSIELYIKLGKRMRPTIRRLGYPIKNSLKGWYNEYQQKLDLAAGYAGRQPKFSQVQKAAAVKHYLTPNRCIAATVPNSSHPASKIFL